MGMAERSPRLGSDRFGRPQNCETCAQGKEAAAAAAAAATAFATATASGATIGVALLGPTNVYD